MPEFDYFNGENFITFDLIEIDDENCEVTVAVSDTGRISVKTFDLLFDGNRRYFEFGETLLTSSPIKNLYCAENPSVLCLTVTMKYGLFPSESVLIEYNLLV